LALALARLGRDDVAVFDGSWTQWASTLGNEIVVGNDL
jgi:thiosulfate/3-mercaptopyruvate sulfurtransferase